MKKLLQCTALCLSSGCASTPGAVQSPQEDSTVSLKTTVSPLLLIILPNITKDHDQYVASQIRVTTGYDEETGEEIYIKNVITCKKIVSVSEKSGSHCGNPAENYQNHP